MPEQSLLQNPVWHALISQHRDLGFRRNLAARYPADVSRFVGLETCTDEAFSDLAEIVDPTETVALATSDQPDIPAGWRVVRSRLLLQMVHCGPGTDAPPALTPLGASDAPEMLALAAATEPGPFLPATFRMGCYVGIRTLDGRLAAMAGERLRLDGYTEISAVCTDPAFRGRGYAKALVRSLVSKAHAEGCTSFLHVKGEIAAKGLYELLGFDESRNLHLTVITRS